MVVSKVAVIALVAIVACPILLGYALNLEETTVTDYKSNNDLMNVSQLLQTGTDWTIAEGDPYQLNSQAKANIVTGYDWDSYPTYNTVSTVKTTMPMVQGTANASSGTFSLGGWEVYELWADYNVSNGSNMSVSFRYNNGDSTTPTVSNVIFIGYYASLNIVRLITSSNYNNPNSVGVASFNVPNATSITYTITNPPIVQHYNFIFTNETRNNYADLADGYYFEKYSNRPNQFGWDVDLPDNTISLLLSINLDSITDADYSMMLESTGTSGTRLLKATTGGVVSWKLQEVYNGNPISSQDLYYNPNISDNTYQVLLTDTTTDNDLLSHGHMQFRYIGHWQKAIGEANYFQTYDKDYTHQTSLGETLDSITFVANDTNTSRTPTIRIDAAKFRAYEYPVITGTLEPASFKTNPATQISNIDQYGTALIFGGNTYTVTNGNITLGTHQIPVKNMVFDSIPNPDTLQYDNRINGTIISTTATPSTLQFVGNWGANVTVASMSATTYTHTEWTPGQFGWDGIDQNFLMVGLLTSIGVFIALGIYIRRTKANLWPLLIVCGGAAVLFFTML